MISTRTAGIVIGLLALFTFVEYVDLFYWIQYGNKPDLQGFFFLGLLIEHAISLVAGIYAGMLLTAKRSVSN